jgi:hypothetical protein
MNFLNKTIAKCKKKQPYLALTNYQLVSKLYLKGATYYRDL